MKKIKIVTGITIYVLMILGMNMYHNYSGYIYGDKDGIVQNREKIFWNADKYGFNEERVNIIDRADLGNKRVYFISTEDNIDNLCVVVLEEKLFNKYKIKSANYSNEDTLILEMKSNGSNYAVYFGKNNYEKKIHRLELYNTKTTETTNFDINSDYYFVFHEVESIVHLYSKLFDKSDKDITFEIIDLNDKRISKR